VPAAAPGMACSLVWLALVSRSKPSAEPLCDRMQDYRRRDRIGMGLGVICCRSANSCLARQLVGFMAHPLG